MNKQTTFLLGIITIPMIVILILISILFKATNENTNLIGKQIELNQSQMELNQEFQETDKGIIDNIQDILNYTTLEDYRKRFEICFDYSSKIGDYTWRHDYCRDAQKEYLEIFNNIYKKTK